MKKILTAVFIVTITVLSISWSLNTVGAQGNFLPAAGGGSCGSENQLSASECGNYTLNDFIRLAVNISKWILGIVGSLTLAMFVYGGVLLLLSGGSSDKVDKAKKTMVAAVVGLAIVLGSSLIIKTSMEYIGLKWDGSINKPTPVEPAPSQK